MSINKILKIDSKELKEDKKVESKKVFKNKEAKISSNSLNSFFNLFTNTPIVENVVKEPINKAFKWAVAEVKEPLEEARFEVEGRVDYKGVSGGDDFSIVVDARNERDAEKKVEDMLFKHRDQRKIGPKGGRGVDDYEIESVERTSKKATNTFVTYQASEKELAAVEEADTSKYVYFFDPLVEAEKRIPKKREGQDPKTHSDLYTDENPKGTIQGLGFKDTATAKASVSKIENSGKTHAHKIQAAIAMEQRAKVAGKTAEAAIYRKYIEKMKAKTKEMQKAKKEDIEEKAPLVSTKKVSEKYKEELAATNSKLDALKEFMNKLDSFEVALGKAIEPKKPKIQVQEKIVYREFDPTSNAPKVVWKKPVVKQEVKEEVKQPVDFDIATIAGKMSKSIQRQKDQQPITEQKSALQQLREEFTTFKQNVITQLASLGGGGSVNLLDLDDVDISSLGNGKFLVYNSTTEKLEFTDQVDGN